MLALKPQYAPTPAPQATSIFRDDLFKGKVVLVTGGGSGIGFGICKTFAKAGASIAICGRTLGKLEKAASEIKACGAPEVHYQQCDIRELEQCQALIEAIKAKFGRLDVLVNNAAGNFSSLLEDVSSNAFKTVVDIDLRGTFHMSLAALPLLKEAPNASVINISAALHYRGTPFQGHAMSAKAGIDVLTNVLGLEWADYGIRVVGIAPGPIANTEGGPTGRVFGEAMAKSGGPPPAGEKKKKERTEEEKKQLELIKTRNVCPVGRYGELEDVSNMVMYVASPAGSFITSTTIVIDGGNWHGATSFYGSKNFVREAMLKQRQQHKAKL